MLTMDGSWVRSWSGIAVQTLDIHIWLQVERVLSEFDNLSDLIIETVSYQITKLPNIDLEQPIFAP